MSNPKSAQALGERIEELVQEYITETHAAAQAAVSRAFAVSVDRKAKTKKPQQSPKRQVSQRRTASELAELGERLHAAMCKTPGETMMVLAPALGYTARDLQRPLDLLRRSGRVKSVGRRQATRYYPIGEQEQRAS